MSLPREMEGPGGEGPGKEEAVANTGEAQRITTAEGE